MTFYTPYDLQEWILNNIDYFQNHGHGYFIVGADHFPIVTTNPKALFKSCKTHEEIFLLFYEFESYFTIDVEEYIFLLFYNTQQQCVEYKMVNNKIVKTLDEYYEVKTYTEEEIIKSLADLMKLLNN